MYTRFHRFTLLPILIALGFSLTGFLYAQEERDYKTSPKAYGLAFDGTYMYYLDSQRRALIRFDSIGGEEIFNLGLARMKGISFDKREGRLLVTAPRVILKIDPNTGGVVDRVPVPVDDMGGVASVDGLYYILDLKQGKVHFFDKASSQIVGGFQTDRSSPRDLSYGKDSIWVSDSSNGIIYRYNPNNGDITGSIQAPAKEMRGILFSGSKLWVVDRETKRIKNIPFVETDRFLASGETSYSINYKLKYSIPSVSLAKAELGILLPPSNEHQRVRNIEVRDKKFRTGILKRSRGVIKKLTLDSPKGRQETEISMDTRLSNMVYFVHDRFLKKKTAIPEELNKYRFPDKENFNRSPIQNLANFNSLYNLKDPDRIRTRLLDMGYPVQTGKKIIFQDGKKGAEISHYISAYLPGFGWVPYSPNEESSGSDNRVFSYSDKEIILFQSPDKSYLKSPVFFRESSASEWQELPVSWSVSISKK